MSRKVLLAPGEFYHVYNRGTEKRNIFKTQQDYERFLLLAYLCNSSRQVHIADLIPRGRTSWNFEEMLSEERHEPLVDICAYCLMPNHFHLIMREKGESGISRFMQKVSTGYTMYFNTKYERSGALFQGKYKAEHADQDEYLKYLISYVHLNPIKLIEPKWKENGISNRNRAEKYLEKYQWSSFLDYCGAERPEKCILEMAALPDYFEMPSNFKTSMTSWLDYKKA